MTKTCQTIALIYLCFVTSGVANAIELQFPVACQIMGNCWITNHVDLRGTTHIAEDYACGKKTSQSSKSTHISLESLSSIEQNFPVIATADGVVKVARNQGGFCGHRVFIDHEKGWKTSYCHLKSDTIQVTEGQTVKSGQIIGAVGMSGKADWPRLSFTLIRNGMIFDPFSGGTNIEGCPAKPKSLWVGGKNPPYTPAHITSIGFTVGHPSQFDILNGMSSATQISSNTPQIALWALLMNIVKGDKISLTIYNSEGRVIIDDRSVMDQSKAYYPIYISKRRGNLLWDIGQYLGKINITRDVNGNEITIGKQIIFDMIKTE